jgi:hypothetical protein
MNIDNNHINKKVMVHYNLNKHTFSITYKNKLITHADHIKLNDVEFRVRPGGRNRVLEDKRKNVHAFVIGTLLEYCKYPCESLPNETNNNIVTYDPYKYSSYVMKDTKEPIYNVGGVEMINSGNKIFITKQ